MLFENRDSLDLATSYFLITPVVESCRSRVAMTSHSLSFGETAAILKVVGDARAAKAVVAYPAADACPFGSPFDHTPSIMAAHAIGSQFA